MKYEDIPKEITKREKQNELAPFPVNSTEVITDLKHLHMITTKESSNNTPVTYCKTCLSLHIKITEVLDDKTGTQEVDYCIPCGNTELETAHIEEWEDLYEEKYGERFLTKKD